MGKSVASGINVEVSIHQHQLVYITIHNVTPHTFSSTSPRLHRVHPYAPEHCIAAFADDRVAVEASIMPPPGQFPFPEFRHRAGLLPASTNKRCRTSETLNPPAFPLQFKFPNKAQASPASSFSSYILIPPTARATPDAPSPPRHTQHFARPPAQAQPVPRP